MKFDIFLSSPSISGFHIIPAIAERVSRAPRSTNIVRAILQIQHCTGTAFLPKQDSTDFFKNLVYTVLLCLIGTQVDFFLNCFSAIVFLVLVSIFCGKICCKLRHSYFCTSSIKSAKANDFSVLVVGAIVKWGAYALHPGIFAVTSLATIAGEWFPLLRSLDSAFHTIATIAEPFFSAIKAIIWKPCFSWSVCGSCMNST